jgi:hypothetical protein
VAPTETTVPSPPVAGEHSYDYAQFDDLLGDAETK